jgi:peptidoglycan/xylan/chitin deacetylase (PgdA/CDA1 family)
MATVLPLRIVIGPRNESGLFPVRATSGDEALEAELSLPDALFELGERLLLPHARISADHVESVGRQLGRALFTPRLRGLLLEQAKVAAAQQARLQLQLQIAVPEVAALPWEWLQIGGSRPWVPGLRDDYTLVRIGRQSRPAAPITVTGPLRILAIGGTGQQSHLTALEDALTDLIRERRVLLRVLPETDQDEIERMLAREQFHVLHCAAPVELTSDERLVLMMGRGIEGFDLADALAEHPTMRLVMLMGQSGDIGMLSAAAPLMGAVLMGDHVPAAITLSGSLPPDAAAAFAAVCYDDLAAGVALDLAVTSGRRMLADSEPEGWGLPQLRMLPGTEQLFVFRTPQTSPNPRRLLPFAIAATLLVALILAGRMLTNRQPEPGRQTAQPQNAATPAPGFQIPLFPGSPPTNTPTSVPPTPTALPAPQSFTTYTVAASDTLALIADRYGSDARGIADLNEMSVDETPRFGRTVVVPVYQSGAVEPGGMVVQRANPNQSKVALTFDIEIDDQSVYAILETLRQRGIKATFFVTGNWVSAFPDAARAIVRDGHELGNHSLTHPYFSRIGYDGAASEIEETERLVRDTTGSTTRPYFRFPYGDYTQDMVNLVGQHGYLAYHWTTEENALDGWLANAKRSPVSAYGAIVLMHGRMDTANRLSGWLDQLAAAGLQPTTLSDALR